MTDRRSRGASWSSNCFQTSSAFGFLFFMGRSRKEVDSPDRVPEMLGAGGICDRQLTVHSQKKRQRLNTEDTETTEVTENATLRWARRRMRRKKKKGETAV